MSFVSTGFVIYVALTAIIYYSLPQKYKYISLLAASYIFYALNDIRAIFFIVMTTFISYASGLTMQTFSNKCARRLESVTEKSLRKAIKNECKIAKKRIAAVALVLCFGLLVVLKYTNFIIFNINKLLAVFNDAPIKTVNFILPLGISFYTFQVTSYIFDIYNGKYEAETNFLHYALYVSWFPALLQGPISRYNELKAQFFSPHYFSLKNVQFALQRILWGFLKKLVIADRAANVVSYIFDNHASLPNYIVWVGLVFYSIQLYADFAGGMDIALGVSELMDIKLAENFRQPFFSQSIQEFWRRWHITLGTWMKDYVFYPFALSKGFASIGKFISRINNFLGKTVPMCIANLLVFFIVGVWHGAEWHFIIYGLYNGILIALGILFKPLFDKLVELFHINVKSFAWKCFRIARTFVLVNIAWVFDDVKDLSQSLSMLRQLFDFKTFYLISNFEFKTFGSKTIFTVLLFSAILFVISLLKENGVNIREGIGRAALPVRWLIYLALILSVPFFQAANMAGFIYARF